MQVPHVRLYALVLTSALTWDGQGDVGSGFRPARRRPGVHRPCSVGWVRLLALSQMWGCSRPAQPIHPGLALPCSMELLYSDSHLHGEHNRKHSTSILIKIIALHWYTDKLNILSRSTEY